MWIYTGPSTAYHDARSGEHLEGIIFVRDNAHHSPHRERPNNHEHQFRGLWRGHLTARAGMLSTQTWQHVVQRFSPSSPYNG